MPGSKGILLIGVLFIIFTISCTKLPESTIEVEGNLSMESVDIGDSIPLEWGDLISVSNVNKYEDWVQLWFQDNEGNIFMLSYNISQNRFFDRVKVLHRK